MVKQSPLHQIHRKLNAKFIEFSGFKMPLQFSSIKDEHLQVRKTVGLFDVSHMSNVWVTGRDAENLLTLTTIEDASNIKENKSQYTAFLREDGTIIDDTIFIHLDDRFMIIPNAGMDEIITDWLNTKAIENGLSSKAVNVSSQYVILAVQGPKSRDVLQELTDIDLNTVGFFGCQEISLAGYDCIISHTGYTGELGFELQINPVKNAKDIFEKILDKGSRYEIRPIGLGARDTLRLEKCFLLAGNEFAGGRSPLEAVMSWAINWDHEFIGKEALLKQKEEGSYQKLTCLECNLKAIPRHGNKVLKDGKQIGIVSSGTLSPCLNKGIAMAYMNPTVRDVGSVVDIVVRGKKIPSTIIKPPFVKKDWISTQE
jgi:aminomethyltransferase